MNWLSYADVSMSPGPAVMVEVAACGGTRVAKPTCIAGSALSLGASAATASAAGAADQMPDLFARWGVQMDDMGGAAATQPITPTGDPLEWFQKLCVASSGILYEDPYLQVGIKCDACPARSCNARACFERFSTVGRRG